MWMDSLFGTPSLDGKSRSGVKIRSCIKLFLPLSCAATDGDNHINLSWFIHDTLSLSLLSVWYHITMSFYMALFRYSPMSVCLYFAMFTSCETTKICNEGRLPGFIRKTAWIFFCNIICTKRRNCCLMRRVVFANSKKLANYGFLSW